MNTRTAAYWTTTALTALFFLTGGAAYLLRVEETVQGMLALGYPSYVVTILGIWKLLGGLAILAPRFPRLKEWAYAGFVFNLTGAVVSHLASGDPASAGVAPAVLLGLMGASWALRPASRVLGQLPTLSSTGTRAAVA